MPNSQGLYIARLPAGDHAIVQQRMATDPNLHLIDGLTLVPQPLSTSSTALHPNDAGFALYAANLAAKLSA